MVLVIVTTALLAFAKGPGERIVHVNADYSHPGYQGFEVHYPTYPTYQNRSF